jgi:hypothetical protein
MKRPPSQKTITAQERPEGDVQAVVVPVVEQPPGK